MNAWTGPWTVVHVPTPLLRKLAGEFADRIALVWPQPHGAFLTTPAARRHLACLALMLGEHTAESLETVLTDPLRTALRNLLPEAPPGLGRALERMGEEAWTELEYRQLLAALADPFTAKVMNHAVEVTPQTVRGAVVLPTAVVRAGGGRFALDGGQASVLNEAYEAIARRLDERAMAAVAERWGRAGSVAQLFEWAADDIIGEIPPTSLETPVGFRLLATKADLREAALRYRNCLRDYVTNAVTGESVFFEWLGTPPAVVQVSRDAVFGWRLNEARGQDNDPVPAETRGAIVAALETVGVVVGPSHWTLQNALFQAGVGNASPVTREDRVAEVFGY